MSQSTTVSRKTLISWPSLRQAPPPYNKGSPIKVIPFTAISESDNRWHLLQSDDRTTCIRGRRHVYIYYIYICVCIDIYFYVCVYIYIYICIYMYIYVYICVYRYIYINTYIMIRGTFCHEVGNAEWSSMCTRLEAWQTVMIQSGTTVVSVKHTRIQHLFIHCKVQTS